jgi:hypothetical protein
MKGIITRNGRNIFEFTAKTLKIGGSGFKLVSGFMHFADPPAYLLAGMHG